MLHLHWENESPLHIISMQIQCMMYCLVRQWLANFISIKQDSYWLALQEQSTPETATFGAEFISGRTCIEQIIEHWNSLRYLGVPINDISYVFGDNKFMINSSTVPHAKLHKHHNILYYHFVRSMVACGYICMNHLRSEFNVLYILSKHWGYQNSYDLLWNRSSIILIMSDPWLIMMF